MYCDHITTFAVIDTPKQAMPTPTSPVSPSQMQLDILSEAVRLVRDRRIRTVSALRDDLLDLYPGRDDDICAALMLWASNEAAKRLH
jgi:hypothetical protein